MACTRVARGIAAEDVVDDRHEISEGLARSGARGNDVGLAPLCHPQRRRLVVIEGVPWQRFVMAWARKRPRRGGAK